jgi:hypothetical protein
MAFDLIGWKERLREHLEGWPRAWRAAAYSVYAGLSAATLWPLVQAARGGELTPVVLTLGSVAAGVGGNLIAEQVQRWKDRVQTSEADVAAWVDERAARDSALREALHSILKEVDAVALARATLNKAEDEAFVADLRADLARLGGLQWFEATLSGSGAIAQGPGAVAAGAGGVAAGRDVRGGNVVIDRAPRDTPPAP